MDVHIRKPIVYLVGAGPGDPGLLTIRGKECLSQADVVIYDQLVSSRVLEYCSPQAELICVREMPGCHPDRWPHIHQKMVQEAQQGKCVVRLKGGDPLIFGRGGEEAEALRNAGLPYEIVPGVTTALAAGAYLDIPLTHRLHSSAITLITGHEHPGKPNSKLDWQAIARFPGTIAIYMGVARLPAIIAELVRHGRSPETPALIVSKVSTGEQRSAIATLATLEDAIRSSGLVTPALILIGEVLTLKPELSWFEKRPLLNQHILVTRPRNQAAEMMRQLEVLGAVPFHLSPVEIREPDAWTEVDRAIDRLGKDEFDWLVFTSTNGVNYLFKRIQERKLDLRILGRVKLATVGSSTAQVLRSYHLEPDIVPSEEMRAEKLAGILKDRVRDQRVLLALADRAREVLRTELESVAEVEQVVVYQQIERIDSQSPIFDHLRRGEIDLVTLTSANIAKGFLNACDGTIRGRIIDGHIRLVTNGSRVTATIQEMGYSVAKQSNDPTAQGIVQAILELVHEQQVQEEMKVT